MRKAQSTFKILLNHFIYMPRASYTIFHPNQFTSVAHITKANKRLRYMTSNRGVMSKDACCQITDLLCQSDIIELVLGQ